MSVTLPISRLVAVNVTLSSNAAQAQALNTMLILGSTNSISNPGGAIDTLTRIRSYNTIAQVAADFGTSAPEYLAAVLWFEQNPQPGQLYIGRWAQAATAGNWFGGPLTSAQQAIGLWNAVTTPTFEISINGTPHAIAPASFAAAASLNAVAALIQTALAGVVAGTTCVWDSVRSRFAITDAGITGTGSTLSLLTATGSGTDISGMLSGTTGAYFVNGIAAESAVTAVTLFDNQFGQQWFGLTILGAADSDHQAVAPYIEAATTKHYYGVTTQEALVLSTSDTTDIAYVLQQAGYKFTAVQYSSTSPYAVVSLLARILTTDYTQNNSVITLMYKQEPGIVPETLTSTQISALEAKNCNVFVAYNLFTAGGSNVAIIEPGVSSSGDYIDTVIGASALAIDIQTAVYNVLFTSTTKVPQTDAGMHLITTAISNVCAQYVSNGLLAPGVWNSNGFGSLNDGDTLAKGYYVFAPPVSQQSQASRAARVSVPIQIAAKLAGAVHSANVSITVNS